MNGFIVSCCCSYLSSCSCSCVFVVDHIRDILHVVFVFAGYVLQVCYKDILASGFDRGRVCETTESAQDASDVALFVFDRTQFVLIILLVLFCLPVFMWSVFVIELSWGCTSWVVVALPVMVVEVLCCCVVGRRVGVDGVEGLFLVCLVSVCRVLVPVEFVVTPSVMLLCCLFRWPKYLLCLVVHWFFDSDYHCFVVAMHVDLSRHFCISAVLEQGSAHEYTVKLLALFS